MKLNHALLLLLFNTTTLLAQDYIVNRDSLQFGIGAIIHPENLIDSVTITNIGTKTLLIDTVYSQMHYGYRLLVKGKVISLPFFIYDPRDLINVTINPKDSVKFIFSKPDLCPVCSGSSLKPFRDTIFVHSNSITKPKLKLFSNGYGTTSVEVTNTLVDNYSLNQNYPNPFNPETTIEYTIPVETRHASSLQHVTLKVYDVLGREIATLVDEYKEAGNYKAIFNVETRLGLSLQSGVYFYRLQSGSYIAAKKLILMK
ncbi:MAG: T9SS type A sorting domain-containing protein [Melioribacteraceae bacterium]